MARVLACLAALLSALTFASAAWAHATLLSSEPADGSVLARAAEDGAVELQRGHRTGGGRGSSMPPARRATLPRVQSASRS
jgi:methionine-rich copper-binding protein CopC